MKIKEYHLIRCNPEDLDSCVREYLNKGFEIIGNPSFIVNGDPKYTTYVKAFQVVVKYYE